MSSDRYSNTPLQSILNSLTGFPLVETVQHALQIGKRLKTFLSPSGIYEVLSYESTLELLDTQGVSAAFSKREKVRYLQNNVIAYQDQAWGDGEILLDYHSTPGKAVDIYRPGRKTVVLISIQNIRQFGDEDEYQIEWKMRDCFLRSKEQWETCVDHKTRQIRVNLVFPTARPPLRVVVIEDTRQKTKLVGDDHLSKLTDGRWMVYWETSQPRLHERYILQWDW